MKGYECENLDLRLKSRVFIGVGTMVINFIIMLGGFKNSMPYLNNINNGSSGVQTGFLLSLVCLMIGVSGGVIVKQYIDDFLSEDKYQEFTGKVVYRRKDVVMIEKTNNGELATFLLSREVLKRIELKEGVSVKMVRTKNSGLIKELSLI